MGVMGCSRNGCESIMCDTYINDVGYVCMGCQVEFKEYLEENISCDNESQIKESLSVFMRTRKGQYTKGEKVSVDEFFNKHTKY